MPRVRKIRGRYYAYFYDRQRAPKEKSYPLRRTRQADAIKEANRLQGLYDRGKFDPWNPTPSNSGVTVKDAIEDFLESRLERDCRTSTLATYRSVLSYFHERLPKGIRLIRQVGAPQIKRYLSNDPNVQDSTYRMRYVHLRAFFRWLTAEGYLERNPLDDLKPPKPLEKVPQYLTPKQLDHLLSVMDCYRTEFTKGRKPEVQWLKDLVVVAVGTGLRLGELCSLTWDAVNLEEEFLVVKNVRKFKTKSGHERAVPLVGDALSVIQRRRDISTKGVVFTSATGKPLKPKEASKRFKFFCRRAGLPDEIRFHSLRHTCVSWLVREGVPLAIVGEIVGHSSVQVTERYKHLEPETHRKAMRRTFKKKLLSESGG